MASTGWKFPTASGYFPTDGNIIYGIANIYLKDGTRTSGNIASYSRGVYGSGFDFSELPDGATIDSIIMRVNESAATENILYDRIIQLTNGSNYYGNNMSRTSSERWPETAEDVEYPVTGALPTVAQIKSSDFGMTVSVRAGGNATAVLIDSYEINIEYSLSTTTVNPTTIGMIG